MLAGQADAPPKSGDGEVEMIRHLKIARDTALKSRTQTMVTLKTLLINAPQPLREQFIGKRWILPIGKTVLAAPVRPGSIAI